jgi:hypothetical protein
VLEFPIAAHIADSFRAGRVFLVRDARPRVAADRGPQRQHRHPGRHNLACKPAAVVKGTAGAGLLDTYDQERRPTGRLMMSQALARFGTRMAPGQGPAVPLTTARSRWATGTAPRPSREPAATRGRCRRRS